MSDAPTPRQPSRWKNVYLVAGLPLLFSPVSIISLILLYVAFLVAVALYAAYIAVKEFLLDKLRDLGWLADSETSNNGHEQPSEAVEQEFPILSYPIVNKLFLGPPLVIYVGTRGAVQAWLLGTQWAFRKTREVIPFIVKACVRGGKSIFAAGRQVCGTLYRVWKFVELPIVEVLTTLYNIAKGTVDACWYFISVICPGIAKGIAKKVWSVAIGVGNVVQWCAAKITMGFTAMLQPLRNAFAATYAVIIPRLIRAVKVIGRVCLAVEAKLRPIIWSVFESLSSGIRRTASVITHMLNRMYQLTKETFVRFCLPPLRYVLHAGLELAIASQRLASYTTRRLVSIITTISRPILTAIPKLLLSIHAFLDRYGIYTFVLSLPGRAVNVLDSICYTFEIALSLVIKHTWTLTLYVHRIATPIFRTLISIANPLLSLASRCFVLMQQIGGVYFVYAIRLTNQVFNVVGQVYVMMVYEVTRAAERARIAADAVGKEVARMTSLSTAKKVD